MPPDNCEAQEPVHRILAQPHADDYSRRDDEHYLGTETQPNPRITHSSATTGYRANE
ncbi:hypothetical protein Y017_00925 [Alcanivorax sp. 97CO-5]|jgi:hypothetical protein|nr:hypothetical protein Y017_00925 [Alcanivorax sp. 97CO-5]BAP14120.1 catalase [Alcanivorax sp. NBRC 101098]